MSKSDILKEIADHHYALADLHQRLAEESATASVSAARPVAGVGVVPSTAPASASYDSAEFDLPLDEGIVNAPQGSLAQCPKHRKPYTSGAYGPYCTSPSDEGPPFGKVKPDGKVFCNITPKNADKWLRQQAAVTA